MADKLLNTSFGAVKYKDLEGDETVFVPVVSVDGSTIEVTGSTETEIKNDSGNPIPVREQYAPAYEDNTAGVAKVEHRYSYGRVTADGQIKSSAGFVHTVTFAPLTATPTAGLVTIYDNTAGSGTVIYSEWIFATDVGHTILLDVVAATGIYVEYDGTLANIQTTVSFR